MTSSETVIENVIGTEATEPIMSLQQKAELLCFGFLRDPSSKDLIILEDIISTLCVRYFLILPPRIDDFKGHSGSFVNEKENTFSVVDHSYSFQHITYAVAQNGWTRGRQEMSIKVLKHNYRVFGLSIGILTNPDIDVSGWMFDDPSAGCSYQYYFGCWNDPNVTGIYEMRNEKSKCLQELKEKIHDSVEKHAMDGAVITMKVDCDKNTIQFMYNEDQQLGETVDIPSGNTYYAAIVYNTDYASCRYQLTSYTRQDEDR